MEKNKLKSRFSKVIFSLFFAVLGVSSLFSGFMTEAVYADPNDDVRIEMVEPEVTDDDESETETEVEEVFETEIEDETEAEEDNATEASVNGSKVNSTANGEKSCKKSLGVIGWLVCPVTGAITKAVDWLYEKIENILVIEPISVKDGSPIYEIWKYCRGLTNIVFIIFLLIVIYSQITGLGLSNYGIKKALPKLIVAAVLINLSFLICSLAVDISNVIGNGLRGVFSSIAESAVAGGAGATISENLSYAGMYGSLIGGVALSAIWGIIALEFGAIWMLIPVALGAIVSVVSGLVTIALRQAVVVLLIMISPLAIVACILPSTDKWFKKWKDLLIKMLIFYPMFSLLFGASNLAGFAIIASAKDGFGLLLGTAVQVFPLFFSWNLMKMSGTFLGAINARMNAIAAKPFAANRAWAESHRQLTRQRAIAKGATPSTKLMQFLSNRQVARDEEANELAAHNKLRGQDYAARRNYRRNGTPSREGEEAYARQAQDMVYARRIEWHKNNMNKGLGQLEAVKLNASEAQKVRLERLDIANVKAADALKVEKARGEKIEYENAKGFYDRTENAINAHFDDVNEGNSKYKRHRMRNGEDRNVARERYTMMQDMMEHDIQGVHYAAATASYGFDTQKKMMESKMQKYFELTPPTKDVEYRLSELTKNNDAIANIDSVIAGLRVLNQRGDTDLVRKYMNELLSHGLEVGSYASQSLASFLMFDVKDNDPFLKRFGKYINLETANVYNENRRKVMNITYDEYIKGYHDGEPSTDSNPRGRMYAKKGAEQLMQGTSLDNVERTAFASFDESVKEAYGYDSEHPEKAWDVLGWLNKREKIQTAFEPAFLSASLKWLSGSEQISSGVRFWTGYDVKQKKDADGNVITDENGDPEYDLVPIWEDKSFAGYEDKVKKFYRKKTSDYFKDQTTGQILGMRTDYRDATMEHLVESWLEESSEEESSDERRAKYDEARAEIQTRYGDKSPEEAKMLRDKDLKKLKMTLAGRQLRTILGATGKLGQIYRTRRSGAANNAKDWMRGWIGLDDEEAMYKEVSHYEELRKKEKKDGSKSDSGDGGDGDEGRIYNASVRSSIRNKLEKVWEDNREATSAEFYGLALDAIKEWFGGDEETLIAKKFKEFYKNRTEGGSVDAYDLKKHLEDLLHDPDNYPDA
ncbi:MFS transporter [Candidatus Saccharibacteria bacterium]|nr:MFS transporter [Candidatus Saccharibacteria bacterium]